MGSVILIYCFVILLSLGFNVPVGGYSSNGGMSGVMFMWSGV